MWKGDRARMEEGGDEAEEGPVRYRSGEKLESALQVDVVWEQAPSKVQPLRRSCSKMEVLVGAHPWQR